MLKPLEENDLSRFIRIRNQRPTNRVPEDLVESMDYETILFVGSGAIESGWKPIHRLCSEIISGGIPGMVNYGNNNQFYYNEPFDHLITSIAFLETAVRSRFSKLLKLKDFTQSDAFLMYKGALETRERLSNFFRQDSSLELRALDEKKFGFDWNKTLVVTTNWDNCTWAKNEFSNVIYLHGHCSIENSTILPTQFATDETPLKSWIDSQIGLNSQDSATIQKNFSSIQPYLKIIPDTLKKTKHPDLHSELTYVHDVFRSAIANKKLKRVFIWGYGFNLYDAEVNMLLTLASLMHQPEIEILDTDKKVLIKASQVLARDRNEIVYHCPS